MLGRTRRDWGLFSLQVVPRLAEGFAGSAWQCFARRWCWDPAPLALAGHGLWARCLFQGAVGGCQGSGQAMLGHGRGARSPPQSPDGKAGSCGSEREGSFPRSNTPGKPQRRTDPNFCLKSRNLGRFSVPGCSDIA